MVIKAQSLDVRRSVEQGSIQRPTRSEAQVSEQNYERNVRFASSNNDIGKANYDEDFGLGGLSLSVIQLETIRQVGLPLIGASIEVNSKKFQVSPELKELNNRLQEDAHILSSLVKITMSLIRGVSSRLSINDPDKSVAVRLVLSGFVSPVVSDYYKITGNLPDDEGIDYITSQIDSVLDNIDMASWLSGSAEQIYQQKIFSANSYNSSDNQTFSTNTIEASLPILQAVNRFAFGQDPKVLIPEIVDYVVKSVQSLANNIDNKDGSKKEYNLSGSLIKAATQLYADCHYEEIERISTLDDQEQQDYLATYGGYSLEPVIDAYKARMNMLQIIAEHLSVVGDEGL
ncbi:MAG: hypothetical protein CMP22_01015 [Rickettsiales bacterium]|nr:hypothetical protein [Rickettsiales bacterium]